ncbi:MAG: tRNA (5-methylaminomethyl-2-thiouridylate)-methyltransferase [Gammaproteobacteria bacterium]|nr:tRNA (5-methylaminomethyl-2-thiouridylate)-methyltransferase [Gammaproteobacteria bacterium]MDH3406435.1 tRNA (5-methylaminomethyl-2-thiouridylate)-methyltransferase [Gammaproteobacteria bacterium]
MSSQPPLAALPRVDFRQAAASAAPKKAVALISGGLDSMLAARLILEQGIHVEGINFYTGFCVEGHTHAIRHHERAMPKRNNALWTAEQLGIKLHIIDVIEEYKDVVINPKHGYGANLNPCLDCKGFMVRKAREWMEQHGFDFIITGEVLGQRPMSQRRDTLPVVARESGAFDRLLRPLCARLLPETLPEREGWVDRAKLLDFNGRSRKPQMALAEKYGIKEYAQPAGGCCFLTNQQYSHKLEDLWATRGSKQYDFDDIMLLKVGRHLRPRPHFKLIVGRDEGENNFLHGYRQRYTHLYATSHEGPLVLIDGNPGEKDIELAARLTARFGRGREAETVTLTVTDTAGNSREWQVAPMPANVIPPEWYL